jgi:membrane associated rhomboid family serine protease
VIPLKDLNPTTKSAVLTIVIILACVGVYFGLQQPVGSRQIPTDDGVALVDAKFGFTLEWAAIPCEVLSGEPLNLTEIEATFSEGDYNACGANAPGSDAELFPDKPVYLAILVSTFMHGGIMHLFGNMLFLWVFGNNIEDRLGHVRFLIFYLAGGMVAALAHILVEPSSTVPVVGASGAIAAVMGAYLVWFPRAPVLTFIPPFFVLPIRARWFLVIWFVFQFLTDPNSGVAWVAHVAGFLFGAAVGLLVRANPRAADRVLPHHPPGPWDPSGRSWHRG